MIDYQTYCQIQHLLTEKKLSLRQMARELKLDLRTVQKWAKRKTFQKVSPPKRESKPTARFRLTGHLETDRPNVTDAANWNRAAFGQVNLSTGARD